MTISSSLNAGVAALSANASRLASISDNIANSATFGYKRVETDFQSMVISGGGGTYSAGGVRASTQRLIDQGGSLVTTNNATDLAVRGRGMLPVARAAEVGAGNGGQQMLLTSTGSFRTDADGILKTDSGLVLLGWPANPDGSVPEFPRDTADGLEPVRINVNQLTGEPTTEITLGLNLPADDKGSEFEPPLPAELQGGTSNPLPIEFAVQIGEDSGAPEISGTRMPAKLALTSDTALVVDGERDWDMRSIPKGVGLNASAMAPAAVDALPMVAKSTLERPQTVSVQPQNIEATDIPITDAKRSADAGVISQISVPAPQMISSQPKPILAAVLKPEAPLAVVQTAPELGALQQSASQVDAMPVRVTQTGSAPLSMLAAPMLQPETRFSYPIDTTMQAGVVQPDMGSALATPAPTALQNSPVALSAAMTAIPAGADNPERGLGLEAVSAAAELRSTLPADAEVRPAASTPSTQVETARQVAVQIADAVRSGEKPIELTLNPAELGRVRLALAPGDGVMMVTVLADRPETLDLMRRHIDMLAQELRTIGYGSTAFSFGQGGDGTAPEGFAPSGGGDSETQDTASGIPETPASGAPLGVHDRLDIRL